MHATWSQHILICFLQLLLLYAIRVAVRYKASVLAACMLGSWLRISLKAWMFALVLLCCDVLWRYRPCDRLIPSLGSPTECLTGFIILEVILSWNRSRDFIRTNWWRKRILCVIKSPWMNPWNSSIKIMQLRDWWWMLQHVPQFSTIRIIFSFLWTPWNSTRLKGHS